MLLLALALRLPPVFADYPFSYYGDELHFIKRAMALGSGDLNPHWFHKPALLMYMLLAAYGSYFVAGFTVGAFGSVEQFGAAFLNDMGPFIVIGRCLVVTFGVATVYVVYRLGRRAYGTFLHGLAAAAAAAVAYPSVVGSQYVKADVPAGFFVALSLLFFLEARRRDGFGVMAIASILAGVAMGTKYYGVVLLPGYALLETVRGLRRGRPWRAVLARGAAVGALFVLGFFLVSPYNLLDPTWSNGVLGRAAERTGIEDATPVYDPDSGIRYVPGLASSVAAVGHFAGRLTDPKALGPGFAVLAALGLLATALRRRTREYAVAVAFPLALFTILCVWWGSFHVNWRHFNAVLPLVCTLLLPGAFLVVGTLRIPSRWSVVAALVLFLLPAARHLGDTARHDVARFAPDTRTVSYRWIVEHLDPDALILLDEYGPILRPDPRSVRRQRQRLEGLPPGEAFTAHQDTRLDLLERFPDPDARNFVELAHPWWMDREPTPEELTASWRQRDASNPIKVRIPGTVAGYRARGVRYVVTNSRARRDYFRSAAAERAFPSFVRFYRGLEALEPLKVFDPEELGGRGPTVWVYDLQATGTSPVVSASGGTEPPGTTGPS